jgi:hypothetical protein
VPEALLLVVPAFLIGGAILQGHALWLAHARGGERAKDLHLLGHVIYGPRAWFVSGLSLLLSGLVPAGAESDLFTTVGVATICLSVAGRAKVRRRAQGDWLKREH